MLLCFLPLRSCPLALRSRVFRYLTPTFLDICGARIYFTTCDTPRTRPPSQERKTTPSCECFPPLSWTSIVCFTDTFFLILISLATTLHPSFFFEHLQDIGRVTPPELYWKAVLNPLRTVRVVAESSSENNNNLLSHSLSSSSSSLAMPLLFLSLIVTQSSRVRGMPLLAMQTRMDLNCVAQNLLLAPLLRRFGDGGECHVSSLHG